jgi:hypothetical protein
MTRSAHTILAACVLAALASCDQRPTAGIHAPGAKTRKGVAEVEPIENSRVVAGQTVYVPAYSSVYTADQAHRFDLAVMLSIRNTDSHQPVIITTARYYDQDGQLVRNYLEKPLRIRPMAAMEFFVMESDTRGGVSASFLVEWVAEQSVTAPVIESVMIGTASTQGISFTCPGRVLADRTRSSPGGAGR